MKIKRFCTSARAGEISEQSRVAENPEYLEENET